MPLLPPPSYAPAWCNAQYDNRTRVPHWPRLLERWVADAADARARLPARLDIPYGPDACHTFDLFEPKGRSRVPHPLLVFIHGGYWRSLSKREFSWVAAPFVARQVKVAIVDYGLAPAYPLEAIVQHNLDAVAWMHAHARELGIADDRIVVAGHSAGGHLAAMMLAARWPEVDATLPERTVRAAVAVSGLFDLEPIRHTPYLNADLQLTLDRVAPLSPLYMAPATGSPLVTAVGGDESEEFLRHTREIGLAWSGVLREDVPLPGDDHFTAVEKLAAPGHRLFEAAVELCVE